MKLISRAINALFFIVLVGVCVGGFMFQLAESLPPAPCELSSDAAACREHSAPPSRMFPAGQLLSVVNH